MAWYEAHQTLAKHPKTLKLASALKCERRYAVGLLHDLFCWGLDAAKKDGTLPGLSAEEIAAALDFYGKKGASVVAALVESGYLENESGVFRIHDWYDYAGKLVDRREDTKRRQKEWKERQLNAEGTVTEHENNSYVTVTERGKNAPTVPNRTVPNLNDNDSLTHSRTDAEPSNANLAKMVLMLRGYRERGWDTAGVYGFAESYGISRRELDEAAKEGTE